MAMPDNRLSTTPVIANYLIPEGVRPHPINSKERGPIAIEDTTEGLLYQNWDMIWDPNTGDFTVTPEDVGTPSIVANAAGVTYSSFTFDQAGRVSLTYVNNVSSYLIWYDTAVAQTVLTDLGADVRTPNIYLDDKRQTQNVVNDMLLIYTKEKPAAGPYALYMKRQRDRFLTEYELQDNLPAWYINAIGMNTGQRVQIRLSSATV